MKRVWTYVGLVLLTAVLVVGCSDTKPSVSAASSSTPVSTTATTMPDPDYAPGRHELSLTVGDTTRTAVLVVPTDLSQPAPLVFAFHGHGGSGANLDRKIDIDGLWPEAIVIYPDGLVGHEGITDPEGDLPGWQTTLGGEGDRDLAFYDTMLATLRAKLPVDGQRIYVMGHSNGSAFTSLLLGVRGTDIAATANISAQPGARLLALDPVRPMFMSMGMTDPLVPYDTQKLSIPLAEQKLAVDTTHPTVTGYLTSETGPNNLELETYVHPAGHEIPDDVPKLIVEFFQRHPLSS